MAERTPLVAANWKMHKTIAETEAFLDAFLPRAAELGRTELVVCPPYPSLAAAVARCAGSGVRVAAQNMHEEPRGAFTGEVAAPMLTELGVDGVILGHSERRGLFGETDEALARKVPAALEAGLAPILCVGETEAERDANQTEAVLRRQLEADLADDARRSPGRARDRLRAGVGDRHRAKRHPRAGRGGDRLHPLAGGGPRRGGRRGGSDPLRRLGEARQRGRAPRARRGRRRAGGRRQPGPGRLPGASPPRRSRDLPTARPSFRFPRWR